MDNTKKQQGVTRRGFIRTVGIGGVAATALGIPGGVGAQAPAGGQAAAMPKRKLGKTGAEVSILCLGGMFDTVNNQLLLKRPEDILAGELKFQPIYDLKKNQALTK